MKKIYKGLFITLLVSFAMMTTIFAAQNKPVELSADTIEYDSVKGVMVAQGNVRMTQDGAVMTGAAAEYNSKSKEAYIYGGVRVVKEDAILVANEVRSYDNTHIVAQGQPVLTKGDNVLVGPKIDYYTDKEYAIVPGGAKLTTTDGVITANQIEAFMKEERAVAEGNVHIVSDTRKLDAVSDHAVYYGKKGDGKAILTGNARAVQDGNVLTGNVLTIYMDEKAMDSQGRSKLVVTPKE